MYISNETGKERPEPMPSRRHIDLEAVKRALDRQADEERKVPAGFWLVAAPGLIIVLALIALF
ncbi:hypothetical protein ACN9JG_21190 (plasmid) [Cereibacter azotoformans]|uniref:hypothetical protein n=1 Tax=Cereibacter TaxID=1653176 RepID=UPI00119DA420|nr:hypothetical protein [Cereibacter sediminicola]